MDKAEFNTHINNLPKPELSESSSHFSTFDPDALWRSAKENLKLMIGTEEFRNIFGTSYIESITLHI